VIVVEVLLMAITTVPVFVVASMEEVTGIVTVVIIVMALFVVCSDSRSIVSVVALVMSV
jgi:hypothetical protein